MVVTLTKSDSSTEDVAFGDFGTKGITASPAGLILDATTGKISGTPTTAGTATRAQVAVIIQRFIENIVK